MRRGLGIAIVALFAAGLVVPVPAHATSDSATQCDGTELACHSTSTGFPRGKTICKTGVALDKFTANTAGLARIKGKAKKTEGQACKAYRFTLPKASVGGDLLANVWSSGSLTRTITNLNDDVTSHIIVIIYHQVRNNKSKKTLVPCESGFSTEVVARNAAVSSPLQASCTVSPGETYVLSVEDNLFAAGKGVKFDALYGLTKAAVDFVPST